MLTEDQTPREEMTNPYAPPSANLELKEGEVFRPFGVKLLAALFILFSVATTVLAYLEDQGGEWLIVLGCSLLLVFLLHGIFLGREKDRKTGVFLGFFIALLNVWSFYGASGSYVELQKLLYAAEGLYGIAAAIYLMKMKESAFFR